MSYSSSVPFLEPPLLVSGSREERAGLCEFDCFVVLRLIYTLRFVGPICRPQQIGERIGACEWRSNARARLQYDKSADSEKSVPASQILACGARF